MAAGAGAGAKAVPCITSVYGSAFTAVPRASGTAAVSVGAAKLDAGDKLATIQLLTKEAYLAATAAAGILDGETEGVQVLYRDGGRTILVNLGPKVTAESVRKATVSAVNKAKALKLSAVQFVDLPTDASLPVAKAAEAVAHAAVLTNYHFDRYVTGEDKKPTTLAKVHIVTGDAAAAEAVRVADIIAQGTVFARDLNNERADEMHPGRLEAVAAEVASTHGLDFFVLKGEDLVKEGMHLMHAVGQAAREPARYVELHYKGDPSNPSNVAALVGKGITFDSGGLNLKGTGFMEDMHMDMGGSAAVLGAAVTVARLKIPRNVVFVLAVAENAIDALSYKPHNIIRSHKGLTVEIGNTDAEGRLVLADALSLMQKRHKPHTIIDLATLTGACVIALGEYASGVFTNSKSMVADLIAAGEQRAERCWHMPLLPKHKEELTGTPFADLKSTGEGRYGGACTAAAFLSNFIGTPAAKDGSTKAYSPAWVHMDIAGPAMYSRDRGFMKKGATGFGTATIVQYLLSSAAEPRSADE